jgi:CRISPR-associated protein Csd1
MIRELSELGKSLREKSAKDKFIHDALKDEAISIDLIIKEDGSFERFDVIEKIIHPAEAITAKKGKARLLLDKAEEVLCYYELIQDDIKEQNKRKKAAQFKHKLFIEKLNKYRDLSELKAVFAFFEKNKVKGLEKALSLFEEQVGGKARSGNIAFRLKAKDIRVHEEPSVYKSIVENYKAEQVSKMEGGSTRCSICGKNIFPIALLHEKIKGVPPFDDGQSANRSLISFKYDAYQSYNLDRGFNSFVCTNCAKLYSEGLNWLLSPKGFKLNEKGKEIPIYPYRKTFGDTAMVFWTRSNNPVSEIDMLEDPKAGDVAKLIDSVSAGKAKSYLKAEHFYSCTLSGAAARIAVRDWIEQSLYDLKQSIALWFEDIVIVRYNFDLKRNEIYYSRLYDLARCSRNEKEEKDPTLSRVAVYLWNAALKNNFPPMWILASVLKRIRVDDKGVTPERAALIRLILNRNNKKGGFMLKEKIDMENTSTAYICGRIFSVLEGIQRAALGKDLNAGIRDRFFSFASTNPSSAFGRLMKMSQNHLSKVKGEKPGLAVILDKELQNLFSKVNGFPVIFTLEEQGQFAIGYYHQKHDTFKRAAENKELKAAIEINDENNEKGEKL